MKRTFLLALFAMVSMATFSQKGSGFGIKGGLNYNENGNLIASVGNAATDIIEGSKGKIGYHVGVFGKIEMLKIYIRPELLYTKTQSSYSVDGTETAFDVTKLDLPVLVGLDLIGPLHVFAGPALEYQLSNDLEGFDINDAEKNFTVGLHAGLGVNLGKLGLDVRYERGFSENESEFISQNVTNIDGRVDSRQSQVIFALSVKF
jgi:hypothetical protein